MGQVLKLHSLSILLTVASKLGFSLKESNTITISPPSLNRLKIYLAQNNSNHYLEKSEINDNIQLKKYHLK